MSTIQPHAGSIPALLIYGDDLHGPVGYVLALDYAGRWALSAHPLDELPNTTTPSDAQPVFVDCGADLRQAAPGATTTITKLEATP